MTWGQAFLDQPQQAAADRPWREPLRLGLLGAGALLIIGAPLPWLNAMLPFHGDVSTNGFDLPGDGAITFSIGLALLALGWFASATRSRLAPVVLAPVLLGLATLSLTITGYRLNEQEALRIANGGGAASDGIGLLITGIGGGLGTLVGVIRIVRAGRSVSYRPDMSMSTAARTFGGIIGSIGSVIAVIALAPSTDRQPNVGGITLLVMFAGLFGAYAGVAAVAVLQRLLVGRVRRPGL